MNFALIFAGGTGQRMNTVSLPKQFLQVHGKEIIVHTIHHFQDCSEIDSIVIVCLADYIDFMRTLKEKYQLTKVVDIVPGGRSGQESIFNGLTSINKISSSDDDIVLIHDGVRPLITQQLVIDNIKCVKKNGTSITVAKANETVLVVNGSNNVEKVVDRAACYLGRAPQSFYFRDIYNAHLEANKIDKHDFIDSAMLMQFFGYKMYTVLGPAYNIKVTTPMDFYMFKAMLDAKENEQIKVVDEK